MDKYNDIIVKLKDKGIVFDKGMSSQEIYEVERYYNISFPTELKQFYSISLPISKGFYNWRDLSEENSQQINRVLNLPIQGLQADLKNGDFWCEEWGEQPLDIKIAQDILLREYNAAPQVIPIYAHRYIPYIPNNTNVPVFSIMQSDIIYYGENLISYLEIEFKLKEYNNNMECQFIDFWSDLL